MARHTLLYQTHHKTPSASVLFITCLNKRLASNGNIPKLNVAASSQNLLLILWSPSVLLEEQSRTETENLDDIKE